MFHLPPSSVPASRSNTRLLLAVAIALLLLLIRAPASAQEGPSPSPGLDAPASIATASARQTIGDDGCTNPAAICIPDGWGVITFTFTGSSQCFWSYGVDWGDGTPRQSFTHVGPGQHTVNHYYEDPGLYTVLATGTGSPANCVFLDGAHLFEVPCTMAQEDYADLPRITREIPLLNWRALTYHAQYHASFSAGWRLCPNASVNLTPTGIRFPLEEGGEAAAINAEVTGIKLTSAYPIDAKGDDMTADYGFDPQPWFEVEWTRAEGTRGQALALHLDGRLQAHWTIYPDQVANMTVCVAVVASGGLALAGAGSGAGAVGGALRAWIQGLRLRYPGIVPAPGAPPLAEPAAPAGAPGPVRQDMALVFGQPFVDNAVIYDLTLDAATRLPGETITYSASGFTPNGEALLILAHTASPQTFISQERVVGLTGAVQGEVALPDNAGSGHWLVALVDLQRMRQALSHFVDDEAEEDALVFRLAANTVVVTDYSYLPALFN